MINNPTMLSFCQQQAVLIDLSVHDPYFILPLLSGALCYKLIRSSEHPFWWHLQEQPLQIWNISFMLALLMVPLPSVYPLAMLGLFSGRLFHRSLAQFYAFIRFK